MHSQSASSSHLAPAVAAKQLGYAFDIDTAPKEVLFDIDFTLARGEFVILTGPSGAGKTTLLTLVGALRALQSGSCAVFGTELAGLSAAGQQGIRRQIGFIFQDHNLFEALTSFQTLALTMELCGPPDAARARSRATELLSELGMAAHLDALPRQLSIGQKQRIAIARALINNPQLILADEPTAALDHDNAELVIAMLKERAHKDGAAILMVTHDNRVFSAADRIVAMLDGRIDAITQFSGEGGRALRQSV